MRITLHEGAYVSLRMVKKNGWVKARLMGL